MPVRVDELTTDVTVEGESGGASGGGSPVAGGPVRSWEQLDAARAARERLERDSERTRAEAYGD